jgi:ABC-type lipoprotein release transport system permease subunit
MNGFETDLRNKILVSTPTSFHDLRAPWPIMNGRREGDEGNGVEATTPFIYSQAMIKNATSQRTDPARAGAGSALRSFNWGK